MRRSLTLSVLFTGVISIAGCGGASFLTNSQNSGKSSTQSSAISTVSVTCSPSSVSAGGAAQCQAAVSGSGGYSSEVTWSVDTGTISNSGLYTAPAVVSGTASATVTATSKQDKNKSGKGVLSFGGSSTGTSSGLSVSATTIAFGTVNLNTTATQSITLTATGTTAVTISGASVTGTGFSLSGATFPITLNPNQTAQMFVAFDPTVAGSATGQLNITSNATSGATTLVNLTGSGLGVTYQVNLSWSAPASSPDPVAGYNVFRAPTGTTAFQQVNSSAVTATSYVDGSVQNGTTYDYVVRSVDAAGALSDPSNTYTAAIPN